MKTLFSICAFCVALVSFVGAAVAMDVTLAWDPNSETDLAGYRIYWATASNGQSKTQTTNKVENSLKKLHEDAKANLNVLPATIEAIKAYATVGEIVSVLSSVYGTWKP